MKFCIHQGTHQGARSYNEDRVAYSYSREALLTVLADGMGGYNHGGMAAQIAVKNVTDAFQRTALPILANPAKFLQEQVMAAHDAIAAFSEQNNLPEHPRTTLVVALIQENKLYTVHAGDSRLYLFREGKVLYRTEDHSKVHLMFRRGLLNFGQMGMHPERNKVYNCLGGDDIPRIEVPEPISMRDGDTVLLCSDGLWGLVGDEKMGDILSAETVNTSIPQLLRLAVTRMDSKSDNMSAIAFNWGGMVSAKRPVSTATMPLDTVTTILLNPMRPPVEDDTETRAANDEAPPLSDADIDGAIAEIQQALHKPAK